AAEGALHRRSDSDVCRRDAGAGDNDQAAPLRAPTGVVSALPPRPRRTRVALERAGPRRPSLALASARPPAEVPAAAHARRGGVSVALRRAVAVALAPRPPVHFPRRWQRDDGRLRAGRVGLRHLRRQLELARADLAAGQLPARRVAAQVPPLLRRRLQG